MIKQSQKVLAWTGKDYFKAIFNFFIHFFIIICMFVVTAIISNNNSFSDALTYLFKTRSHHTLYVLFTLFLIFLGLFLYFYFENRDFIKAPKNINMIFVVMEVSLLISIAIGKYYSIYARPFLLCALLILLLSNRKISIIVNLSFCFILYTFDTFTHVNTMELTEYFTLVMGLFVGLFAIYIVNGIRSRLKVIATGFIFSMPVIVGKFLIEFDSSVKNPITPITDGLLAGFLSVVLLVSLLPFFEVIFNKITDYRLTELTDHKANLINKMIQNAPGTFNHALVVSTLAESCATAIGENPLLARACAYYHDVGKLKQPEYFTENQNGYNPHNELSPELSTDIIRSHAKNGYDLILKNGLPKILADVAVEHHGTLPIKYFYIKATKFTEGELDIKDFSYPGPKPRTKIAAIIMIADGSEAKVRTIPNRTHELVDKAVKEIIEERMEFEQFTDCEITMKELDIIRKTITNSLAGVYHDRVEYPKLKLTNYKIENEDTFKNA